MPIPFPEGSVMKEYPAANAPVEIRINSTIENIRKN